jgi:protein-disulfide isomerase
MPKAKPVPEKKAVSGPATVTIDIQPFLTPISILLSSIIIAVSIFFTFHDVQLLPGRTGTTTGTTVTATPTVAAAAGDTTGSSAKTTLSDNPVLGNKSTAKVAIVEFSDFECPFCKTFSQTTLPKIVSDYVDSGKAIYIYRYYPLSFHEPNATKAAMAAACVNEQGGADKFYKFATEYFSKTIANGTGLPAGTTVDTIASGLGLDTGKLDSCITAAKFQTKITTDTSEGTASGVNGTPGFIIGTFDAQGNVDGVSIPGAQDYSVFKTAIDSQLAR